MIPQLDECRPNIRPLEYYVLIAPETVEEKTAGGIILPAAKRETDEVAVQRGRVVAMSPLAFGFATGDGHRAAVGDVVLFGRYAGSLIEGEDGRTYRICRDKDVAGVFGETVGG
jgi:co-chaperonin GroES (HSP10)